MSPKISDTAYSFHKKLNGNFANTEGLLTFALPVLCKIMRADRIYFFNLNETQSMMSLSLMCKDGLTMDMQENISLLNKPQYIEMLINDGIADSDDLSYPAVYVLLRWRTGSVYGSDGDSAPALKERLGVLRIERVKTKKKFTVKEKELILALAEEMSYNMLNTEIDQDSHERLRVAEGLNELTAIFAKSLRFSDGIELILKGVQKYFRFDRARLYLFDYKGKNVKELLSADISGVVKRTEGDIPVSELQSVLETDIFNSPKALNLPLSVQGKRVGVLLLDNILSRRDISQADFLQLKQFSSQIALALDNAVLFERVQDLYNYDDLTKLPVRRYFMEKLNDELYRSKRFDLTMSLIIMDLDYFKEINDTFGHQVGDYALIAVSELIRASLRQTDFPCRFGGDEIMIMLPRTSVQEAKYIAKRMAERVSAITIPAELTHGEKFSLSVTQGISVFPLDAAAAPELIHKADLALYHAKTRCRGTVSVYKDVAGEIIKDETKDDAVEKLR